MKFKMQVKVNFTVAERYHYHHATRAHQQQSRPRVSLQHGGVEAVRKQAASKRATKGKRPARESVEAKDEIIAEDEFRSHWKTAKVHQDWAKRICPIRIR